MKLSNVPLTCLFYLLGSTCFAQEPPQNLYVDSTGQVYVQTNAPIYFFISSDDTQPKKEPIPSHDEKANPMFFDGDGLHYLQYTNNGKRIKYMIIADGQAPKPHIKAETGLILARKTRIYAEANAQFRPSATDKYSGTKEIYIAINGNNFSLSTKPFSLQNEGENDIKIFAIDNVGNISDTTAYSIIISPEVVFRVDNIHFETGSSQILAESKSKLAEMLEILQTYPELQLQVDAHADTRGSAEANLALSQRRAVSVVNYLVSKGILANRIKATGYGDTKPTNECLKGVKCSDSQHLLNRRVEFRFMLPK